jgi:hypothetical protein
MLNFLKSTYKFYACFDKRTLFIDEYHGLIDKHYLFSE